MREYFPDKPPRWDPTAEEKTRMARKFCRRARLADMLLLSAFLLWLVSECLVFDRNLDLLGVLLLLAGVLCSILTFTRCPCCGRLVRRGDRIGPFVWRGFQCPVCDFMPDWNK